MKKLLSLLTIVAVSSTASLTTISCNVKTNSKKDINLDTNTVTKDLKNGLKSANPYDVLRTVIAAVASSQTKTTVKADDIKNDNKIIIQIKEDDNKLDDNSATRLSADNDVNVNVNVASGDKYFATSDWNKTLTMQASLDANTIDLTTFGINAGTTYAEIYQNTLSTIAKVANITTADLNGVNVTVTSNNETIANDLQKYVKYGDSIYVSYIAEGSKNFKDTNGWITSKAFVLKASLTKTTVNLADDEILPGTTTYSDVYNDERTDIANAANVDPSVIATGVDKDAVRVSLFVNGNYVSDDSKTNVSANDQLIAKYEVVGNSKYFNDTGWLVTDPINVSKASVTGDEIKLSTTQVSYGASYESIISYEKDQLAKAAGVDASKLDMSKIHIQLYVNGQMATTGTLGHGDSVYVTVSVDAGSKYFNPTTTPVKSNSVLLDKVTLQNSTVNLSSYDIQYGTAYTDIYNKARTDIAKVAGIKASDIASGSEKDSVWLSLIVNGNAVVDGAINYGDSVSMKFGATKDSKHYNATSTLESNEIVANKAKVDGTTIDLNSETITANITKNSDVYSYVRSQIAKAGNISSDDIATGSEKDTVQIALYVNNNAAKDDSTLLKPGDNITVKINITSDSKHFMQTSFNTTRNISKVDVNNTNINWKGFPIIPSKTSYSQAYDYVRSQIAKFAGIDASEIKSGDEANAVQLSLIVNGNAVVDGTFKYGDSVSMKYNITNNSKHFNSTNGWQETEKNNVAKFDLTTGNINLNSEDFTVNKSTYDDVRDNVRSQIANTVGIDPSIIQSGSEKNSVLISLIVNGKAVDNKSGSTTLKPGDTFSVKYWVTANSHYFQKTTKTLETNNISFNKDDPSSIKINTMRVNVKEKNSDIWNSVYNLLATNSGLSISDIQNDSNIIITIFYGNDKGGLLQELPNDDQTLIKSVDNQLTINISIHNDQYFNDWDSQFVSITPLDLL